MEQLATNNVNQFDINKAYQERPIIQSLSKEYSSLNQELSSFLDHSQRLLICFTNLRNLEDKINEIQIEKKEELNFQKSLGVDMEGIDPGILMVICCYSFFI